ncbi:MAG: sugar-binding domain-containing protein [Kiritimatiellia bacterium]|jgi:hypothetical protein
MRHSSVLLSITAFLVLFAAMRTPAAHVWLEGEAGQADVPVNNAGWGNAELLSGGKWMQVSVEAGKVGSVVPEDGAVIRYPFSLDAAGPYEVWGRIGYEFVRSAFEWRLDDGDWQGVSPEELTTDLMPIDFWCEVAWLKFGDATLAAGEHALEIRLPRPMKDDGVFERILFACDAICIATPPFRPNGRFKPDESGRDAEDEAASRHVFQLPEAAGAERAAVSLKGVWEIARDDEQAPGEVAEPIQTLPRDPVFRAIAVPGDKGALRKDLEFAHRVWYRTRVHVPASMAGRSFQIEFPLNNLNTTVYVNGRYCGFEKNPFCRFAIDVTDAVKPGRDNEILVGIRDAWYGRSADPENPMKLRKTFNFPRKLLGDGFQDLDYPVWNCPQSGILATPVFHAAGPVYAADVFVKPSVARQSLDADITLRNTAASPRSLAILLEAVDPATGAVEAKSTPKAVALEPNESRTVPAAIAWASPKLWWPDSPTLYTLRTTVLENGRAVDIRETPFGFREWTLRGTQFLLNGVPWPMWSDLSPSGATPELWAENYHARNQRAYRFSTAGQASHDPHWFDLEPHEALDFFDANGIVVRRNTTLDGEMIGYQFRENDPAIVDRQDGSNLKLALMENWRDQCVAQVKGERNHPSIQIWTIENEFAYINLINLLGNSADMDAYEAEIKKTHDAVMAADPTRSVMIDGGGALKDNSLGVHGDHYVATLDTRYPDLAYETFPEGGGRGRWAWDAQRPRYLGEDFYAAGIQPAEFAPWGGEATFQGQAAARDAVGLCTRMLTEGYRWGGHYAAWTFWIGAAGGPRQWEAYAPRAVFCRQWDWTFGSGQKITRTFGIFNDTRHAAPLTFTRTLSVGGKNVYAKRSKHSVAPGAAEKFDETIAMPAVAARTEGVLTLELAAGDRPVFRAEKAVSILPPPTLRAPAPAGAIAVFDPHDAVAPTLSKLRVPFVRVASLANPPAAKVLLVGPDALVPADSTSPALAAHAAAGHAVVVLDQTHPLEHRALPAEMETVSTNTEPWAASGNTGFIEDSAHPVFTGLANKDFFTWGGAAGAPMYRNAYTKPEKGGRSLLQVGPCLGHTALVEVPVGKGVLLLSQLAIGGRLERNATAQRLLLNLIETGLAYKREFANVAAVLENDDLEQALDDIGLRYSYAANPLEAISDPGIKIAVVSATPEHLAALAGAMPQVQAFWERGGTILFHGLDPEGLASYNRIVGVRHLIRPFRRERVQLPAVRDPLTAGLSNVDVVMFSGKRIFGFRADEYTVDDAFTHIVDLDDIAPFATSDFHSYGQIINGFIGADGWPLIIDFPMPEPGQSAPILVELPREETVTEIVYDSSVNYNPTTRLAVRFDGGEPIEFPITPDGAACVLTIDPPRRASEISLEPCAWDIVPDKARNHGIDNIWIRVARDEAFHATVRPMLNIGGLVRYVKGPGGVVLCNLKFQEHETVPINKTKKRKILATVLRNLKAPFDEDGSVIVGAPLAFSPVDIHTKATTFKDEKGWFGDRARTFAALPAGRGKYAGVEFDVYEMPTSPTPQVLMIRGDGAPGDLPERITGIPVNRKADALFFLHTAKLAKRMSPHERAEHTAHVLFNYVVNYADGQKIEIPIRAELDIGHYVQKTPSAIPGAQLAWTAPYDGGSEHAAAYAKQWDNPRPDVEIASVDMIPVDPSRGAPALLALTAATLDR